MKTTKRLLHDRRAITPVLSNLLLMVVAVAAMAIATSATYVITANLRETMGERVIIEDVWFDDSSVSIGLYLRNVGRISMQISAVYVNNTRCSFAPAPFILGIEQHGGLNVSQSWGSGDIYHIKVVSTRRIHVGDYFKAP